MYMESYLQGQDLWEMIDGADTVIPPDTPENVELWKNGESSVERLFLC